MIFENKFKRKRKLVTNNKKNVKSATCEIRTHDLIFTKLTSLPIVLSYLFKIEMQLKVYGDAQVFVIFKNTNNLK